MNAIKEYPKKLCSHCARFVDVDYIDRPLPHNHITTGIRCIGSYKNHYDYLDEVLPVFMPMLEFSLNYEAPWIGLSAAHGDKAYGYKDLWEEAGIPFYHGVLIFLMSYFAPYSNQVRETENGWVDTWKWVIDNYPVFKERIIAAEKLI